MNSPSRNLNLCDHGAGCRALVSPGRRKDTNGLVVSRQAMNPGFDENEAELGVLVFAIALEMLADGDSLTTVSARATYARTLRLILSLPS